MRASSWGLPVLSVFSLLVIGGSVAWAEATNAQPHAVEAPADEEDAATAGNPDGPADSLAFQVCAKGNYAVYVTLPKDGNAKSPTAQPGKCVTATLPSAGDHSVAIFGLEGTAPFEVGDDEVGGDSKVSATGTIENPDYTVE